MTFSGGHVLKSVGNNATSAPIIRACGVSGQHNNVCVFQGGLIFVCGSREGLMEVGGRRHNTDDIIATVLAVESMKFIYRGRYVGHGK